MPASNRRIEFKFNGQRYSTGRVIGYTGNFHAGPTVVFLGGIHGNEPSGVIALQRVLSEIKDLGLKLRGNLLALAGNLTALERDHRFIDLDLNRIWTQQFLNTAVDHEVGNVESRNSDPKMASPTETESVPSERIEQQELAKILNQVLSSDSSPKYFFDLHTTSSRSAPFIAINDQLANRDFARHFPVATIFGIEEYLEGPLLSWLNDFGHVAFAFEAGQHDDPASVDSHCSFIKLALFRAGLIEEGTFFSLHSEIEKLKNIAGSVSGFFEVIYREPVEDDDRFVMEPGYENFHPIRKKQLLAHNRGRAITACRTGQIFMPLYQTKGQDGFFIIRPIPGWALLVSRWLRKINFDLLLPWLPGVSRSRQFPGALIVNKKIAFLLRNQLFHLMGYRRKKDNGRHVIFSRREIVERKTP